MSLVLKNPPANAGDLRDTGSIPGLGRSPGGGHGNHSSILAWRIPWREEPGGLQSTGSQRVEHNWSNLACIFFFLFFFKFKFIYFNWRLITLQYCIGSATHQQQGFPDGSDGKASACNAGDPGGSIPGLGRYPGERNGNPLQYSCLGNPMDGGAWQATVHGATLSWIWLSDFSFSFLFLHNCNLEMI